MVELLRYLEANGFTSYIASGGGRDFMRPVTAQMYGPAPERVIGSSVGLDLRDGQLLTTSRPEFLDDGPVKPVRIWGRTGRGRSWPRESRTSTSRCCSTRRPPTTFFAD
jgi:hypothetical protein